MVVPELSHLAQEMRPLMNGSSVICATWSAQRWKKCQTLTGFAINVFLCGQTTLHTPTHNVKMLVHTENKAVYFELFNFI